jgi:hypothetical protein
MNKDQPRQLTKSVETKITLDWATELPGLGVYQPRWLIRRVGPLLVGVCLDRDSGGEKYKPCFHAHFLGKNWPYPEPTLTMNTQLRAKSGGPDFVEVRWHDEKYRDAANRLQQQAPLPLNGPIAIDQALQAYQEYAKTPLGQRQSAILVADCIQLLAWSGRVEAAQQLLEEALVTICDDQEFNSFGGLKAFKTTMEDAIRHPDKIKHTVDSQIRALGVENLPFCELIC